MNKKQFLLYFIPLLGVPALVLRYLLYTTASDEKGLLLPHTPLELGLWALTLFTLALTIYAAKKMEGSNDYASNFPADPLAAFGSMLFAFSVLLTSLQSRGGDTLQRADLILGCCSAVSLVLAGVCRLQGKRPFYGLYTVITVFLAVRMLGFYKIWSSDPQMVDYVFAMGAVVCLTLFAYSHAAFTVGLGKRKMLLTTGLMGGYLCLTAIYMSQMSLFLVGGYAWLLTNLCAFSPENNEDPERA